MQAATDMLVFPGLSSTRSIFRLSAGVAFSG